MKKKVLALLLSLCLGCAVWGCGRTETPGGEDNPGGDPSDDRPVVSAARTIFYGDDNGEVLHNPLMGWSYYGSPDEIIRYGIPDAFDVGIIRCSWDEIEATRGQFDFRNLTNAIHRLRNDGKMVYLRLYLMPDDVWNIAGYPAWVKDVEGVGEFKDASINNGAYKFQHPDYGNAVYRGLVKTFLERVAAEYPDGAVDVIDARAYGLYGEWDSEWGNYWDKTDPDYKIKKQKVLNDIVAVYADAFKDYDRTKIALNVPSVTYSTEEEKAAYEKEGAYDAAMKAGFALRFDAVETVYHQNYFYEWLRAKNYPATPVFAESCYGWDTEKLSIDSAYRSFCLARSNVATFGFFKGNYEAATDFNPDFYTDTMRPSDRYYDEEEDTYYTIGYRIRPERISFNKEANTGGKIHFESSWVNTGWGVLYNDYPLALSLSDADGKEVYVAIRDDFDITGLIRESAPYAYSTAFNLPGADVLPAGVYTVRVALVDKYDNNRSAIAMPLSTDSNETRDYAIGTITLK